MRWRWWRFPSLGRYRKANLPAIATPRQWGDVAGGADADASASPVVSFKGIPPPEDLQAVQEELIRQLKLEPATVEPYLALADLHRAHGESHKALPIRQRLALRPGLDKGQRARLHYEMGRDHLASGDHHKALEAFEVAHLLLPRNQAVRLAIADCALRMQTYRDAARLFAESGRKDLQAHALARHAQALLDAGNCSLARRYASRAASLARTSPEGWVVLVREAAVSQNWKRLQRQLRKGLEHIPDRLGFVLLEAILYPDAPWHPSDKPAPPRPCCIGPSSVSDRVHPAANPLRALADVVQEVIAAHPEVERIVALPYYAACLCRAGNASEATQRWLEKALKLEPTFWRARMELAALQLPRQETDAAFTDSMHALVSVLSAKDRFACSACGFQTDTLFFHCPQCASWRTIELRLF